jgi:hypothetical protein
MGIEAVLRNGNAFDVPPRTCCQKFGAVVRNVIAAVAAVFARIGMFFAVLARGCFQFISRMWDQFFESCCIRRIPLRENVAAAAVLAEPVRHNRWNNPIAPWPLPQNLGLQNRWNREPAVLPHLQPFNRGLLINGNRAARLAVVDGLVDDPVDMEALRAVLRRAGANDPIPISRQMTPQNFSLLVDEFPDEKMRIGAWAKMWAKDRPVKIDRDHRYWEIFQKAFEYKNQIEGGIWASNDYRTYSTKSEDYYGERNPLFTYVIYSLSGFQELDRAENRELMRKLDNGAPVFDANPAYMYARALSKIFVYPTSPEGVQVREVMDIPDKLHMGIGAPWEAYEGARGAGKILDYFKNAFPKRNCFDWRVSEFQEFLFRLNNPNVDDLSVNLVGRNDLEDQVLEHYRVFSNTQIFKMSRQRNLEYAQLKSDAYRGVENQNTRVLNAQYRTKDNFALYLQENNQPVRERLKQHSNAIPIHVIPQQVGWRGTVPQGVKAIDIGLIPEQLRIEGGILGVRNPRAPFNERNTIEQIKVHQIPNPNPDRKIFIDFRGEPVRREKWEPILDRSLPR